MRNFHVVFIGTSVHLYSVLTEILITYSLTSGEKFYSK